MQVGSLANRDLLKEKREMGVIGSAMRSLMRKTAFAPNPSSRPNSFELLESIEKGWAHPSLVVREFYNRVPLSKRVRIYETIGRSRTPSLYDQIMNRCWRSQESIDLQARLDGRGVALKDPYLYLAPFVERALKK